MGPFGLKLGPNEAESFPGPFGSPPGPIWAHFGPKNPKIDQAPKIPKISEIWTLAIGLATEILYFLIWVQYNLYELLSCK